MDPIIGMSAAIDENDRGYVTQEYTRAVAYVGGIPVILPVVAFTSSMLEETLATIDGLMLTGGGDVNPRVYGGDVTNPDVRFVIDERDDHEFQLVRRAVELGMPVLGICRGSQVLNVALGGTLYEDVKISYAEHDLPARNHLQEKPFSQAFHTVTVHPGTALHRLYRERRTGAPVDEPIIVDTNSIHHQAVKDVAPGLRTAAHCDCIVEAVETTADDGRFLMGVQWHPEYFSASTPLIGAFVDAARAYRRERRG